MLGNGQVCRGTSDVVLIHFRKVAAPCNIKLSNLARRVDWSVRGILDNLASRIFFILPDPVAHV